MLIHTRMQTGQETARLICTNGKGRPLLYYKRGGPRLGAPCNALDVDKTWFAAQLIPCITTNDSRPLIIPVVPIQPPFPALSRVQLQEVQQKTSRFYGLTAANPERKELAKSVQGECASIHWQVRGSYAV